MDKPKQAPLVHEENYSAPISHVWESLTDEAAMREWYFPQLMSSQPKVGFDLCFQMMDHPIRSNGR